MSGKMSKKVATLTDRFVGNRVRMRRLMLGMTLSELGDALGIVFQHVEKYEKGQRRLNARMLLQLSTVLHVPVSFFFEGAPRDSVRLAAATKKEPALGKESLAEVSRFLATTDGLKVVKAFIQIKDVTLRRRIADLLEQIAEG